MHLIQISAFSDCPHVDALFPDVGPPNLRDCRRRSGSLADCLPAKTRKPVKLADVPKVATIEESKALSVLNVLKMVAPRI
jgi:hypothetical protein